MTAGTMTGGLGMPADLVFEGGGVKGIGLAGAFGELCDQGYLPFCLAGTSAGAITAALVAAGYSAPELEQIVLNEMDFRKFADGAFLGPAGELTDVLDHRGMHSGKYFLNWIRERLSAKGITSFGDLHCPTPDDGGRSAGAGAAVRQYRLQVIVSDLSGRRMLVLPRDAPHLGLDPDRLGVAEAVRMSMSIPIFFEPVLVVNEQSGNQHVLVDGGMLSNFPVWLFDCPADGTPSYPTFGMLLVAPNQRAGLEPAPVPADDVASVGSGIAYFRAMADTMMQAHDRFYLAEADYARTISIPTLGVRTTEFDIPPEQAKALFESGRTAARQFLSSFDFGAYIERFRTPSPAPAR